MALTMACQEALWLRSLAKEVFPSATTEAINIGCDNLGAIELAMTSNYRQRTKHIDVRHHFIRETIEDKQIAVKYIPTEEMVADALTKPVFAQKLLICCEGVGLK